MEFRGDSALTACLPNGNSRHRSAAIASGLQVSPRILLALALFPGIRGRTRRHLLAGCWPRLKRLKLVSRLSHPSYFKPAARADRGGASLYLITTVAYISHLLALPALVSPDTATGRKVIASLVAIHPPPFSAGVAATLLVRPPAVNCQDHILNVRHNALRLLE